MRDNVRAPLDRTAIDGRREGIVNDQRNTVCVRCLSETLNVKHDKSRIRDRLAEDRLGVRLESCFELFIGAVRINERKIDAHATHSHVEQVEGTAVDRGGRDNVVSLTRDIENREECCRLAGGGQHRCGAAFHRADLSRDHVVGRVLQAGVEIAARLKVKQLAHVFARVIFERGGLNNRDHARIAVFRLVSGLNGFGFKFHGKTFFLEK